MLSIVVLGYRVPLNPKPLLPLFAYIFVFFKHLILRGQLVTFHGHLPDSRGHVRLSQLRVHLSTKELAFVNVSWTALHLRIPLQDPGDLDINPKP